METNNNLFGNAVLYIGGIYEARVPDEQRPNHDNLVPCVLREVTAGDDKVIRAAVSFAGGDPEKEFVDSNGFSFDIALRVHPKDLRSR